MQKRTKLIGIIIIACLLLLIVGVNLLVFKISTNSVNGILVPVFSTLLSALVAAIAALSVPFITDWIRIKNLVGKYRIDIQVKCLKNNMVLFSASVENVGDKDVVINVANIYIDEGKAIRKGNKISYNRTKIEGAVFYDFPFLLQHQGQITKTSNCILCKKCRDQNDLNYPIGNIEERFKSGDFYYTNIELKHLTKESVTYIGSNEKYSEDIALQFKKNGVYRVTLVVVSDGSSCQCATKQFYIYDDSLEQEKNKASVKINT